MIPANAEFSPNYLECDIWSLEKDEFNLIRIAKIYYEAKNDNVHFAHSIHNT